MRWLVLVLLAGCAWAPTHKGDPETCRERMAKSMAQAYPDPNNMVTALNAVCVLPPPVSSP